MVLMNMTNPIVIEYTEELTSFRVKAEFGQSKLP